jgi:hypothetical protein
MMIQKLPTLVLRASAFAVLATLFASTASAMTIRELRALEVSDKKQGEAYVNYYLVGVMEGALEAHAHGLRNGAKSASTAASWNRAWPRGCLIPSCSATPVCTKPTCRCSW